MAVFNYLSVGTIDSALLYRQEGSVIGAAVTARLGYARAQAVSKDGHYLATVDNDTQTLVVHKITDGMKQIIPPALGADISSDGLRWSADGKFLACALAQSPFLRVYRRTGDEFVALADPAVLPGGGVAVAINGDGTLIALAFGGGGNLAIYSRDENDTLTTIAPDVNPPGSGRCVSFSPEGDLLVVGTISTPAATVYRIVGGQFSRILPFDTPPASRMDGLCFSPDGAYLFLAGTTAPSGNAYKRVGDSFQKLSFPQPASGTFAWANAFSPDSKSLLVGHSISPYYRRYNFNGDTITENTSPLGSQPLPARPSGGISFTDILADGMARVYDETLIDLLQCNVDLGGLKIALLTPSAEFNSSDTTLAQATNGGATEAYGFNWPQGGIPLSGVSYQPVGPGVAKLVMDDAAHNILGGSLSAAYALIYDDTHPDDKPLAIIDFEGVRTANSGERFAFEFSTNGLLVFNP